MAKTDIIPLEKEYLIKAGITDFSSLKLPYYENNKNNKFDGLTLRNNLLKAQNLLKQAGWEYKNGALRNKENQLFSFEVLDYGGSLSRVISAYVRNLNKLGIEVKQRTVDSAIYQKRVEKFDYDMITVRFPDTTTPGNELVERFSSKSANVNGSDNVIGANNKVIDNILSYIISSKNQQELIASTRALDRVLLNEYYVIPHWYSSTHRIGYSSYLQYYKTKLPLFYSAEPWVIGTWWASVDN
jgi:microcin C transport system substrate-binding protein